MCVLLSPRVQEASAETPRTPIPANQPELTNVPMEQEPPTHAANVWGWVAQQLTVDNENPNRRTFPNSSPEAHVAADLITRAWD
eukprot:3881034-Heterocapsa_arctica.AAC.1